MNQENSQVKLAKESVDRFGEVYDRYFDSIFTYVLHRVANVAEAQDLTAQTFFNALKSRWRFKWNGVPLSAWLFRIASNEVNSFMRRKSRRRATGNEDLDTIATAHGLPDRELFEAEQNLAQHGLFLELHRCIAELGTQDQTLIVLRYLEQKSFAEIAQILGKREGTVIMSCHRGLKKLKHKLKQRGIDHERVRTDFSEAAETAY